MDLFISYARSTSQQASFFADAFRTIGYDVWMDEALPGHRPYADVIREQLEAARAVLVIWSADATASEWVRSEADFARKNNKLIQLSIEDVPLPMPFDQIHCVDMRDLSLDSIGWQPLLESVAGLTGHEASTHKDLSNVTPYKAPRNDKPPWQWIVPALMIVLIGSVLIWRFSTQSDVEQATETVPADSAEASSKVFDDRTLVILPFENLSSDPEQSYFASGLTMDMISQFTAWGIPVIRASRDHYSGDISPAKIAADLSVRNIVHGSVQRSRDRIRVNVNVVDAESGVTRYSQTFDREISGFFEMQDEMSIRIGSAVMGDIATARLKSVSKKAEHNLDAWGLYALGMQSALELGPETSAEAAAYFQRALELEPDFAEAKSWLGFLQSWRVVVGTSKDPEADLKGAVRTIRDALRLNPRNAQIHTQLAFPLLTLGDVKAAGEALQRAEELGGRTPFMLVQLAMVKIMENEPEASIEASLQAIKLDPHGPSAEIYYDNVAIAAFESGQYEMGLDAAQRVIAAGPQFHSGYWTAAANLVGLGRIEEAKEVINEARVQVPGISIAMIQQAFNYERPEADAKRAEALRTAGLD